jgi:hypothetical protein
LHFSLPALCDFFHRSEFIFPVILSKPKHPLHLRSNKNFRSSEPRPLPPSILVCYLLNNHSGSPGIASKKNGVFTEAPTIISMSSLGVRLPVVQRRGGALFRDFAQ